MKIGGVSIHKLSNEKFYTEKVCSHTYFLLWKIRSNFIVMIRNDTCYDLFS